jgi:hypothetical protein
MSEIKGHESDHRLRYWYSTGWYKGLFANIRLVWKNLAKYKRSNLFCLAFSEWQRKEEFELKKNKFKNINIRSLSRFLSSLTLHLIIFFQVAICVDWFAVFARLSSTVNLFPVWSVISNPSIRNSRNPSKTSSDLVASIAQSSRCPLTTKLFWRG